MNRRHRDILFLLLGILILLGCTRQEVTSRVEVKRNDHIVLIGNNTCSRMMQFGYFETETQLRFPEARLHIRNMCDGGNTPGFRPHAGRKSPWAFPGAEQYQSELANPSGSRGHFETPDEWLARLEADLILAFFGYSESFSGPEGIDNFRAELSAFAGHTLKQQYNGISAPQLVLVSPTAFQDLSDSLDLPDGTRENVRLFQYKLAMQEVARELNIPFIDLFTPTRNWYNSGERLTIDGFQLNDQGHQKLSAYLAGELYGDKPATRANRKLVHEAVLEKNWYWEKDFKAPNGVHVFGRRYEPFGPDNYPAELKKIREMTAVRDTAIWLALEGKEMDVDAADARTTRLPGVETNFDPPGTVDFSYKYGQDALNGFTTAPGYRIELFASESDFPDLANPVQVSFDNQGRLWVAVMPTYPHYRPGDPKPNDKLIILEDLDVDGKADRQKVFADQLHLPIGFEFAPEGVYVSQGTNLVLLRDTDGDDRADAREIMLSGFDDHDTHHAISAFCADPSGAIYMGEGVFLHTSVETPYGTVRGTNGGFYRFQPQRHHLERTAQIRIPNPWGIAFDDWGQPFYAETSGPPVRWMLPSTIRPTYGKFSPRSINLVEPAHRVRPTSGLEFVSSRHFPEEVQGDYLINNTIGFLGTKMHALSDDGTGYASRHRLDLVRSSDPNFRPVDMEFAPDGSLFLADWHNVLIGHMQHNARDPLRDHVHGRIYRITYPSRPLVDQVQVDGAPIEALLDHLKLPEYRTRYRVRRELRGRDRLEVIEATRKWVAGLDSSEATHEQHKLEALWVTWGLNQVDRDILSDLLNADDFRLRAAAVRVLRYVGPSVPDRTALLVKAAGDPHGRVRLEAIVAASWLADGEGIKVMEAAGKHPLDDWMAQTYAASLARILGNQGPGEKTEMEDTQLEGEAKALFQEGYLIYNRDGHCASCHQPDGKGLATSGFPPLAGSEWVLGDPDRLVKLTLKGLYGPIRVKGKSYPGLVPMTPFGGLLNDREVAAVLTYVRNAFDNESPVVSIDKIRDVRDQVRDKKGFYTPGELLQEHPF